jgi:hypothetical protein
MKSRQSIQSRQSHNTPATPSVDLLALELTLQEVVQLSGNLNRILMTLHDVLRNSEIHLPTIEIES